MKALINLVLTFMMSTTFVFAGQIHTQVDEEVKEFQEMATLLKASSESHNMNPRQKAKLLKRLKKKLKRAKKRDLSYEKFQNRYQKRVNRVVKGLHKRVKRTLRNKRLFTESYKAELALNPKLSREEYKLNLEKMISKDAKKKLAREIKDQLSSFQSEVELIENAIESIKSETVGKTKAGEASRSIASESVFVSVILLLLLFGGPVAIIIGLIMLIAGSGGAGLIFILGGAAAVGIMSIIGHSA